MAQEDRDEREEAVILGSLVGNELMIFAFLLILVLILLYGKDIVVAFYFFVAIALSFLFLWIAQKIIGKLEWIFGFSIATLLVSTILMLFGIWGYIWLDYYYSSLEARNYHAFFGVIMLVDLGIPGVVRFMDFLDVVFSKRSLKETIKLEREQTKYWKKLTKS